MIDVSDTELLTYEEAAEKFNVPAGTLRQWALRKELSRYRRGDGRILIDSNEVREVLRKRQEVRKLD